MKQIEGVFALIWRILPREIDHIEGLMGWILTILAFLKLFKREIFSEGNSL